MVTAGYSAGSGWNGGLPMSMRLCDEEFPGGQAANGHELSERNRYCLVTLGTCERKGSLFTISSMKSTPSVKSIVGWLPFLLIAISVVGLVYYFLIR